LFLIIRTYILSKEYYQLKEANNDNLDFKNKDLSVHETKQETIHNDVKDWDKLHNVIVFESDANLGFALVHGMAKNFTNNQTVDTHDCITNKEQTNKIKSNQNPVEMDQEKK